MSSKSPTLTIIYLLNNYEEKFIKKFLSSFSNIEKPRTDFDILVLYSNCENITYDEKRLNNLFKNYLNEKILFKIIESNGVRNTKILDKYKYINGKYFYIVDGDDHIHLENLSKAIKN